MIELIDTHCHLDVAEFCDDYREVLDRAVAAGVSNFVVPGVDRAGWPRLQALCRREARCHPALGLHPLYLDCHRSEHLIVLEDELAAGGVCAVGEIGLDFWDQPSADERQRQTELFEQQLRLANRSKIPVLLHARKAHDQVLAAIRRCRFRYGGIVHAFSGSRQQADCYVELGFAIGVGGTITYRRATRVRGVVAGLPLAALVLETDAPDISTAAHKHERNSPEYLPEILASLVALRSEGCALIAAATTANARRVLRLPVSSV